MNKNFFIWLAAIVVTLQATTAFSAVTNNPARWEKDIRKFEDQDATNPPPQNAILFIGSSSIRLWKTLEQDFPNHRVINRGFGGSQIEDSTHFFDRVVLPYRPRLIVMYAGGNDINAGKTGEQVYADFTNFVAITRRKLPETKIAYIAVAPNPARWSQLDRVKKANELISDLAKRDPKIEFIDVFSAMLGPDGHPKPEIFVSDQLHMNEKGYAIWTPLVLEYLGKPDSSK